MHILEICMGGESIYTNMCILPPSKKINIYLFLTFFIIIIFQKFCKKEHIWALRFLHSFRENCALARRENEFKLKKSIFNFTFTPSPQQKSFEKMRNNGIHQFPQVECQN